jgi:hypothetical protein
VARVKVPLNWAGHRVYLSAIAAGPDFEILFAMNLFLTNMFVKVPL